MDVNRLVDDAFQAIKAESKIILDKSRRIIAGVAPELREEYSRVEALRVQYDNELAAAEKNGTTPPSAEGVDVRTLEELKAELETQRANLELNLNTNPGVVEQYEKRKRDVGDGSSFFGMTWSNYLWCCYQIEVLEETIEERQRKADKIERNIKNARVCNHSSGHDRLTYFLCRITGNHRSRSLSQVSVRNSQQHLTVGLPPFLGPSAPLTLVISQGIGCAGEIRISEHEDYEKWAIDILVKFRDSEKLQLLTGQRQSGGVRISGRFDWHEILV